MSERQVGDPRLYKTIINHEEQYSFWPESKRTPEGWKDVGKKGSRENCLQYIEEVWADMRPRLARETAIRWHEKLLATDS
ncbi:MAG TPA: MbtH family NRPS accessory protein [Acidobacteriota bacterium]|nr:MbtH family NRPS accessory protein [Acidobacteriota bacterium]